MSGSEVDHVAAVKASIELMIAETEEVHEYFNDLVEKLAELEELESEERRQKFTDLVQMGAFRFNGLDIRHFTRSQTGKPLPPPIFFNRTKRRLKNTGVIIEEFQKRGIFEQAEDLLREIETLSSHIVNENDHQDVLSFKEKVDGLRGSDLFQAYVGARNTFVQKDSGLKADTEFIAAKETVEEGEEMLRQRGEELAELGEQLDKGELSANEAGNLLDKMSFDKTQSAQPSQSEAAEAAEAVE